MRARRSPEEERIAQVYAQQQRNEQAIEQQIAPIRARQQQINREREKKSVVTSEPPPAQPPTPEMQEAQAKKELEGVTVIFKRINLGVSFGDD